MLGNLRRRIWSSGEDVLTDAEASKILVACENFLDNVVVRVPLYTGMRIGEGPHPTPCA